MTVWRPLAGPAQMSMFATSQNGTPTTRPARSRAAHPSARPMARHSDPPTANGAAIYAMPNVAGNRAKALAALVAAGPEGANDFELETMTGVKQTSIGKRRLEIQDAGLVEPLIVDGKHVRRFTPTGALAGVYVATQAGIDHHRNQPPAPAGDQVADAAVTAPSGHCGDPSDEAHQ